MKTVPLCMVTIIAEVAIKERILGDIRRLGAHGYTLTDAEGEGSRGRRVGELLGANFRLESIVSPEVADRILQLLTEDYFNSYAIIAYLSTVSVVRGDKYV